MEQKSEEEAVKEVKDESNQVKESEQTERKIEITTEPNQTEEKPEQEEPTSSSPQNDTKSLIYPDLLSLDPLAELDDDEIRCGFLYAPYAFVGAHKACVFQYVIHAEKMNNVVVSVTEDSVNCRVGVAEDAACTVRVSKQTMMNILNGYTSVTMAIMCGEVAVDDPAMLFSFGNAFKFKAEDLFKFQNEEFPKLAEKTSLIRQKIAENPPKKDGTEKPEPQLKEDESELHAENIDYNEFAMVFPF